MAPLDEWNHMNTSHSGGEGTVRREVLGAWEQASRRRFIPKPSVFIPMVGERVALLNFVSRCAERKTKPVSSGSVLVDSLWSKKKCAHFIGASQAVLGGKGGKAG